MSSNLAPEGNLARPRKLPGIFALGAVLLTAALLCPGLAHAGTMTFCVDKASPMLPTDMAVARAVAQKAGDGAAFVLRDSTRDASDDDDDLSGRSQLKALHQLARQCDLIMGFTVEDGGGNIPEGMRASRPYARTGFVAVGQGGVSGTLNGLLQQGDVGVLNMTPASTYFGPENMTHEHVYDTNEQLFSALLGGEVKTALIWRPWLNQELTAHPQAVHVAELNMPYANWNVVALYPQTAQNNSVVKAFNAAIAGFAASRRLGGIVKPYDVPSSDVSRMEE